MGLWALKALTTYKGGQSFPLLANTMVERREEFVKEQEIILQEQEAGPFDEIVGHNWNLDMIS